MPLSRAEQLRRQALLQGLLDELALDALVIAANDYRGHKGTLRWATDYNLDHRHGFAVVLPGGEPELVLPLNLAHNAASQGWSTPVRHHRRAAQAVLDLLHNRGGVRRVGVIGRDEIMRVGDAELLARAMPQTAFVDVSAAFERIRARKSEEELAGVREATAIAEACFARLLAFARPGMTEREIGAEMYAVAYRLGGEDPLFLSMSGERLDDGTVAVRWNAPRDRVLGDGDDFTFSFELIGRLGYWMEFARAVVFGTPSETQVRLNRAVAAGMEAAAAAMRPGAGPQAVQAAMLGGVTAHGAESAYWSGHGLGQDVIEEPWIGREVVDADPTAELALEAGMVLAMHPMVLDLDRRGMAYLANSYVVGPGGGEAVSQVPLGLRTL